MGPTRSVYVTISNADENLRQARWSELHRKLVNLIRVHAAHVHDEWASQATSPRQSACVHFDVDHDDVHMLQHDLRSLAAEYQQPGIVWAEAKHRLLPAF